MYGSIDIGASLVAAAHVIMEDATQAAQTAGVLNQYLQQARPLFDKLTATSDGAELIVTCEMSLQQVERTIDVVAARYIGLTATP